MVEKDLRTLVEGMSRFARPPFACEEEADLKLPTLSHRQLSLAFRRRPHHYFTRFLCQQCYLTNIEMAFLLPVNITDWKLCTCYLDVIYASKGVLESVLFCKISFGSKHCNVAIIGLF